MTKKMKQEKAEKRVLARYRRSVSSYTRRIYHAKALREAKSQKHLLIKEKNEDNSRIVEKLASDIYKTYEPIIEEEIENKIKLFQLSDRFETAVKAEMVVKKKLYSNKTLGRYRKFPINIPKYFVNKVMKEVNKDKTERPLTDDEVHYILLCIFYKIIEFLKKGYEIKFGTLCRLWFTKRDVKVNLPDVKQRILSDRLVPKLKLCNQADYSIFYAINADNQAIINYYEQKTQRYLLLFKRNSMEKKDV